MSQNEIILKNFIRRVETDFEREIRENSREGYKRTWLSKYPEKRRFLQKKYTLSEKGVVACERRKENRLALMRKLSEHHSEYERLAIKFFYDNCPEGYTVDHIIPVSKGGEHCITNLQYLSPIDNSKKATDLYFMKDFKVENPKLPHKIAIKIGIMKSKIIKMKENLLSNVQPKE